MHITVRLFASHREAAGIAEIAVELPAGSRAVDALDSCRRSHPRVPGRNAVMAFAVNRELATPETELNDGDEVAVLPPVAGG